MSAIISYLQVTSSLGAVITPLLFNAMARKNKVMSFDICGISCDTRNNFSNMNNYIAPAVLGAVTTPAIPFVVAYCLATGSLHIDKKK